jgi:hypothetical protein
VPEQALDRVGLEQVAAEVDRQAQPAGTAEGVELEVETRAARVELDRAEAQSRALRALRRRARGLQEVARALEGVQHLEEGIAARVALGLQRLDQLLEGQILVLEGAEHGLAHAAEQLAEGRIARQVGAQHEAVHEAADERLRLGPAAPGDRRADDDVRLARVAVQQRLERGQQRGEQRRSGAAAEALEPLDERGVEVERAALARVARERRPRMVGRQVEEGGARQPLPPVLQVAGQGRVVEVLALPGGEVAVLQRQRRQRRGAVRRVQRGQLVDEARARPAVEGDVVDHRDEDVLVFGQAQQPAAHQRPAGEIDGAARQLARLGLDLGGARRGRHAAAVDQLQPRRPALGDALHGLAVALPEGAAQHLVPGDDRVEAGLEPRRVERALEPEREADVVERAVGQELVQEPQPALREGHRPRSPLVQAPAEQTREPLATRTTRRLRAHGPRRSSPSRRASSAATSSSDR